MRLALITASLVAIAACGEQPDATGPERRSAAGEVLGGEVTDDMLPLDTARSTSPPDPRAGVPDDDASPARTPEGSAALPKPVISGGPEPYMPAPPGDEPTAGPPPE